MSLWIELPAPLFAEQILTAVRAQGVDFLPGRHFAPKPAHERAFRISFGALPPAQIEAGLRLIGQAAVTELAAFQERLHAEPAMALV